MNCVTQIENIDVLLLLLSFVIIERYCYCYYSPISYGIHRNLRARFMSLFCSSMVKISRVSLDIVIVVVFSVDVRVLAYFYVNRSASNSGEHSLFFSNDYFLICLWHAMVSTVPSFHHSIRTLLLTANHSFSCLCCSLLVGTRKSKDC